MTKLEQLALDFHFENIKKPIPEDGFTCGYLKALEDAAHRADDILVSDRLYTDIPNAIRLLADEEEE